MAHLNECWTSHLLGHISDSVKIPYKLIDNSFWAKLVCLAP